jgi:PTS system glucose-specific IIA component
MIGIFRKNKSVEIKSPVIGNAIDITTVPDEVFAKKKVGDGVALEPEEGILYSPVNGTIVQVFPTKHAVGIRSAEGLEILLHVGIDTVTMKGEGFENFVIPNQEVRAGDKLITFDCRLIREKAKSTIIPLIITNMDKVESLAVRFGRVDKSSTVLAVKIR